MIRALLSNEDDGGERVRQLFQEYTDVASKFVTSPAAMARRLLPIVMLEPDPRAQSPVVIKAHLIFAKEVLRLLPQGDAVRVLVMNVMMRDSRLQYKASGSANTGDLLSAFRISQELMIITPAESTSASVWINLATTYTELFAIQDRLSVSDSAVVELCRVLLSKWQPPIDQERNESLSDSIKDGKVMSFDLCDLAAWCAQLALELTSQDSAKSHALRVLRAVMARRYDFGNRKGSLTDLNAAIDAATMLYKQAFASSDRVSECEALVWLLDKKFASTRKETDLDRAIEVCQDGISYTTSSHPKSAQLYAMRVKHLREKYNLNFEISLVRSGLAMAMAAQEPKFDLPTDVNGKCWWAEDHFWLWQLSIWNSFLFQREFQDENIDRAITCGTRAVLAVESAPALYKPFHLQYVSSLGFILMQRYKASHAVADIDSAIVLLQGVTKDLLDDPDPNNNELVYNLVIAVNLRYLRLRSRLDLDALLALLTKYADRPVHNLYLFRIYLCRHLWLMYEETGETNFRDRCIDVFKEVEDSVPDDDERNSEIILAELSFMYNRFKTGFQDTQRMKEAVVNWHRYADRAVKRGSPDLATQQRFYHNLGRSLLTLFQITGEGLDKAIIALREASETESFPLLNRITFGLDTARALTMLEEWEEAYAVLKNYVDLIPLISSHACIQDDQQYMLGEISSLAPLACSVALVTNSCEVAVELLEAARGAISSLIIDSRSDVSALKHVSPILHDQYLYFQRQALEGSSASTTNQLLWFKPDIPTSRDYERSIRSLRDLRTQIRQIDGFERFQLPLPCVEICELARDGPLISFAVSEIRADAIIVTRTGTAALRLPKLSLRVLEERIASINSRGNQARRDVKVLSKSKLGGPSTQQGYSHRAPTTFQETLLWLWQVAVRPVLEHLNLIHAEPRTLQQLPHVFWVGGGLMSLLPLHAAGEHSPESTENAISHVISSYASTYKALRFVRDKAWTLGTNDDVRLLAVAIAKTAGHADLDVVAEMSSIEKAVQQSENARMERAQDKTEVLQTLPWSNIFHCACHGSSDPWQPLDGGLLIGDTANDKLTLRDLKNSSSDLAQIAYLSACSTAQLKNQQLVEESVHLAAMFQLIGFRHVIGTLWGAFDLDAVTIASIFYETLFDSRIRNDPSFSGGRIVSYALHKAVLKVRSLRPDPERWAPFVHFGPSPETAC